MGNRSKQTGEPNPAADWLPDKSWWDLIGLESIAKFSGLTQNFIQNKDGFKALFESEDPYRYAVYPWIWELACKEGSYGSLKHVEYLGQAVYQNG